MRVSKFSREIELANLLRDYLRKNEAQIIQLVSPGGQATVSLTYQDSLGKAKTIFPDLLAIHEKNILIAEIKPKYSRDDEIKLLAIKDSINGFEKIRNIVIRRLGHFYKEYPIRLMLVHGQSQSVSSQVDQLILTSKGAYILAASND
jgi:hypothetical protein